MNGKVTIGITDCTKYANYEKWMLAEPGVETIKLSYSLGNLDEVAKCDGILLTGGEDVHPRFYHRPDLLALCDAGNMDEKRDEFEWKVMQDAQQRELPVLGICRGLQVANVFFGGTLVPDIPSTGKPDHSKTNGKDRYHRITVQPSTLLSTIVTQGSGDVNSAHHQSADRIGTGLFVNALSDDGVVEGLERKDQGGKPFLLLVQWHPERMEPAESPLSANLRRSFLESALQR